MIEKIRLLGSILGLCVWPLLVQASVTESAISAAFQLTPVQVRQLTAAVNNQESARQAHSEQLKSLWADQARNSQSAKTRAAIRECQDDFKTRIDTQQQLINALLTDSESRRILRELIEKSRLTPNAAAEVPEVTRAVPVKSVIRSQPELQPEPQPETQPEVKPAPVSRPVRSDGVRRPKLIDRKISRADTRTPQKPEPAWSAAESDPLAESDDWSSPARSDRPMAGQ